MCITHTYISHVYSTYTSYDLPMISSYVYTFVSYLHIYHMTVLMICMHATHFIGYIFIWGGYD